MLVDDLRVWAVVRSAAEVAAWRSRTLPGERPRGWWGDSLVRPAAPKTTPLQLSHPFLYGNYLESCFSFRSILKNLLNLLHQKEYCSLDHTFFCIQQRLLVLVTFPVHCCHLGGGPCGDLEAVWVAVVAVPLIASYRPTAGPLAPTPPYPAGLVSYYNFDDDDWDATYYQDNVNVSEHPMVVVSLCFLFFPRVTHFASVSNGGISLPHGMKCRDLEVPRRVHAVLVIMGECPSGKTCCGSTPPPCHGSIRTPLLPSAASTARTTPTPPPPPPRPRPTPRR